MDADVLAEVLSEALETGDVSAAQLKKFELARREDTEKFQKQQLEKEAAYQEHFAVPALT
jgi:2-polyprenyl-6-methoxyphenol hydroxylase-like FAD-dependent oxidoreductase